MSPLGVAKGYIRREAVVNKLRELGFTYKGQGDRMQLWKQKGTTRVAGVRRSDFIPEAEVRAALKLAGCTDEAVEDFLREARLTVPAS